jgi:glycosyltransferase involved in cell wall biosynthesis
MKVLFWVPYPKAESPSQRFRFEQYLPLLSQNSIQYKLSTFWDEQAWRILYLPGRTFQKLMGFVRGVFRRVASLFTLASYDYIFIHREAMPLGPPVFEWIAHLFGKKIIYDFDDAIWLPNTSAENKIAGWLKWHNKVRSICRWSTRISCGNELLCSYAKTYNKNVVLNPTTIDTQYLHNPLLYTLQKDSRITIGWTGTHSTIKYLEFLEPIIHSLEQKFPGRIRFLVIANKKPDLKLQSLEFIAWNKATEIPDLLRLDIGVMPLTDDIWAKGKCGFKALQYMALGVPCVISPVGVNSKIVDDGATGFLASTETEWTEKLEKLMADESLREAMGRKGREKVEAEYSVNSNAANFIRLFN